MSVRIITDSASDMSPAEHPALDVLPLSVTFGTDVYMDGVDIDHQRFYEMLVERDELPKTGQVNPYAFSQGPRLARKRSEAYLGTRATNERQDVVARKAAAG